MCESEKKKVNESCWASRNIGTALVMVVFNSYFPTFPPENLSATRAKMMPTVNELGAIDDKLAHLCIFIFGLNSS